MRWQFFSSSKDRHFHSPQDFRDLRWPFLLIWLAPSRLMNNEVRRSTLSLNSVEGEMVRYPAICGGWNCIPVTRLSFQHTQRDTMNNVKERQRVQGKDGLRRALSSSITKAWVIEKIYIHTIKCIISLFQGKRHSLQHREMLREVIQFDQRNARDRERQSDDIRGVDRDQNFV